ncbi:MAG: EamA family transporter [Nitrincola lacisaponensis]|uniref:Permeases of the drug/metabolite transporter (DMT) superfamily n=1 Tax=Nitrincola lacisaponensis TaxID=267850 RepID=A0A063Y454_9GAMM|nr:DMT family transporter [Nitrincola lacisaponensis]KDE39317.1 Permeases of the drug/metabolite transporter (DMT) superfamily [Nitrincola lacisaponensis]
MLWIPFTIFAAFMQAWRNAFQKKLSQDVSSVGVTLARFLYAGPLAVIYLIFLYQFGSADMPVFTPTYGLLILLASLAQIAATVLMVMLFRLRNYAMGVGLAKSEAVIAAILGALFFSALLTPLAWLGVFIGGLAIWLMANPAHLKSISLPTLVTGLGSGLCFALTTLWVREASLMLGLPFLHSAAWVLLSVILLQTLLLLVWVVLREPATLAQLWRRPQLTMAISLCSFLGSLGWFTAMSLETVALVKTLGQIEILFTLIISARWFRESLSRRDLIGLGLIVVGAVCVILA